MRKSIFFLICLLAGIVNAFDKSYLLNNRVTQYISNFQDSLDESLQRVYNGLNLMFKFDRDAYEEFVRFRSPEESFYQNIYEEGFQDVDQWNEYHNEQSDQQKRDLQSWPLDQIHPYYEEYSPNSSEKTVGIIVHQYRYYCNNTRVKLQHYLELRKNSTFNGDDKPKEVSFDAGYNNYRDFPNEDEEWGTGLPRLKCDFDILKPTSDGYTLEEMNEYGLGEVCKVLDDNNKQKLEITLNCTQGINPFGGKFNSVYFETMYDMDLKDKSEFWLKNKTRFIYFPWDPKFNVEISFQDFKYLSHTQKFSVNITDPKQLLGEKSITVDLDLTKLNKTYAPGGRYFYRLWLHSPSNHYIYLEHNTGLMAIKDYEEPKKSPYDYYLKMFTFNRVLILLSLVGSISLGIFLKRRKKLNKKRLLEQAD